MKPPESNSQPLSNFKRDCPAPQVLFAIWNALKEHKIEIPYPQRVVHHVGLNGSEPPTT